MVWISGCVCVRTYRSTREVSLENALHVPIEMPRRGCGWLMSDMSSVMKERCFRVAKTGAVEHVRWIDISDRGCGVESTVGGRIYEKGCRTSTPENRRGEEIGAIPDFALGWIVGNEYCTAERSKTKQ